MNVVSAMTNVCGILKAAGRSNDAVSAGVVATAFVGVTLSLPWSAVCAAGIIAVAGAGVVMERRESARTVKLTDDVREWVEAFARDKACQAGGLAAAIEAHLADHPGALGDLPEAITRDHLTTFLSIIKAQGEAQTKLLEEHDGFVRAVSAQVIDRLEAINKSLRRIEGLAELTHGEVLALAAHVRDLGTTTTEIRSMVRELLWKHDQSRSPALSIPLDTTGLESQRFIFRARTLACVGRRAEFVELDRWLYKDTRPFSWNLWTGDAGMGKSRLALELCLKAPASWDVGFMDWDAGRTIDWNTWTPKRNTLIVCDYVAREVDRIKTMLDRLAAYNGSHTVRVLLLERPIARFERPDAYSGAKGGLSLMTSQAAAEGWWTRLGIGTDGPFKTTHARQMARGKPDRLLRGVSDETVKDMIRADQVAHQTEGDITLDNTEIERRAKLIEEVTPNRRPLFVAMTAEAIRERVDQNEERDDIINTAMLINYIREKEDKKHWTPALEDVPADRGTADGYRRLLCFATLCGGLTGDALAQALDDDRFKDVDGNRLLPNAAQYGDGAVYARLIPDSDTENAPKLEPDLLGECFVLSFLMNQPDLAAKMVAVGWHHARNAMVEFLEHAAMNFSDHMGLGPLLNALPDGTKDAEADEARASILLSQATLSFRNRSWSNLAAILLQIREAHYRGPNEEVIRLLLALSSQSACDAVYNSLARVDSLLLNPKVTDEHIRQIARGLYNGVLCNKNNMQIVRAILKRLYHLVNKRPGKDVTLRLARAITCVIANAPVWSHQLDEDLAQIRNLLTDQASNALREQYPRALQYAMFVARNAEGKLEEYKNTFIAYSLENPHAGKRPIHEVIRQITNQTENHELAQFVCQTLLPMYENLGVELESMTRQTATNQAITALIEEIEKLNSHCTTRL